MRIKTRIDAKILLCTVFVLALFSVFPAGAKAANLYFSPSSGDYAQNENFTVGVLVNTGEAPINAVSGTISFPTEYGEVLALSTVNSFVSLWVQNPSFSNSGARGNIRFEGIILNPGYAGSQGRILDIVFRVKKIGSAGMKFDEFSILANDGQGTNIGAASGSALFTFTKSVQPSPSADTSGLTKRMREVEKQVRAITESQPGAPIVVVQKPQAEGFLMLWEILPSVVKGGVLLLVGIATVILLFVLTSFGVIILIWIWSSFWHNRFLIARRLAAGWIIAKKYAGKIVGFLGLAEREITGDIVYGMHEMEQEFQSVARAPSLKMLLANYWSALRRITKRFLTRNQAT